MGIKPQDFLSTQGSNPYRMFEVNLLNSPETRRTYLLWYPIIMASSFIRAYRDRPFAPEYIIPQLLMQWGRDKSRTNNQTLYGFRYFFVRP